MAGSLKKEDYYIIKFDGTNFTIWKQRMMDVLVNKGLAAPLKDRKESVYNDDQWEELDARARATISLHLGESIFFTIMDKTIAFELWDSLCSAWDGKSASNKVFLMKKLMRLSMKEPSNVLIFTTDMPYDALLALDDCYAQAWIIDSGASFHVTPHREWFATYSPMHGSVKLGDSHQLVILGIGDVNICMANGTQFMLKDVRHVPKLSKSLVSTGQLDDLGYTKVFKNGSWLIRKANLVILKGQKSGTLYPLYVSLVKENGIYVAETMPSTELWHSRLGHISQKGMKTLQRFGYLPVLNYSDFSLCEHCIYGKQTRLQSAPLNQKLGEPLDLVHSDLCGPMPHKSLGGASYFLTFIDDSTHKVWVYLLKRKDEVANVAFAGSSKLSVANVAFAGSLLLHTPAQNGIAERMNRLHAHEMAHTHVVEGPLEGLDAPITPLIVKLRRHVQGYVDKEDFLFAPVKHEDVLLRAP
ncbi:hypothetical protein L7F22_033427 [Adiantum nelumboides]|nr:hypothetical protein [Adiantum nelumboides]